MSTLADALEELMGLGVEGPALIAAMRRLEEATYAKPLRELEEAVAEATRRADAELAKDQARKARDAERKRVHRASADIQGHPGTSEDIHGPLTCTQVVIPSLPSLRSEELKTSEAYASSVNASKPAPLEKPKTKPPKADRGTRLAPDWEPSSEEFDLARSEGLTDEEIHRAALEFRNYWCSRSRDATRLSWRLTWHNRVIDLAERKRREGARMAARPAFGGGGGRGVEDFASIVARRRGATQN